MNLWLFYSYGHHIGVAEGKVHTCAGTEALYRPYGP